MPQGTGKKVLGEEARESHKVRKQELEVLAVGGSCSLFCFLFPFISFMIFLAYWK